MDAIEQPDSVWQEFHKYSSTFGLCSGGLADLPGPHETLRETIIHVSWPEDWRQRYLDLDYVRRDPAVLHIAKTLDPFTWSEALAGGDYDKNQTRIVHEASDFQMSEGFVVPLLSTWSGAAVITMAGDHLDLSRKDRAQIHLGAIYCHSRIRALSTDKRRDVVLPRLSPRERECLQWAAIGKTDWEIGEILSISEKTINTYLERVKLKYGVTSRVQAVAYAIRTRAIKL